MVYEVSEADKRYMRLVLSVLIGMIVGGTAMWAILNIPLFGGSHTQVQNEESVTDIAVKTLVLPEAVPLRLRIPAVGLDTTFEGPLGVEENGTVSVPDTYTEIGWYEYGPTPGERGPAIVLGHVDSYEGPAVFYPLKKVKVGDEVLIERDDGLTAIFEVTETEKLAQNEFPTERVYGDLDYAGLRLITCTGTFDKGIQRYSHNLIVYATLVRVE